MTVSLYNYIRSELMKAGKSEFVDENGELVFFDDDSQFLTKILKYDTDVSTIIDKLFTGTSLTQYEHDMSFKKGFTQRFLMRRIGRQTIEGFRVQLLSTFLSNQRYINEVFGNIDRYIQGNQVSTANNQQTNTNTGDSDSTTDNRSAFANLPQNNVQLDVNNTVMTSASDNTISRNKQTNNQNSTTLTDGSTDSDSKVFQLEQLLKSNGLEKEIYNEFDRQCFLQVW